MDLFFIEIIFCPQECRRVGGLDVVVCGNTSFGQYQFERFLQSVGDLAKRLYRGRVITEDQVLELVRCGVMYDEDTEALSMFV